MHACLRRFGASSVDVSCGLDGEVVALLRAGNRRLALTVASEALRRTRECVPPPSSLLLAHRAVSVAECVLACEVEGSHTQCVRLLSEATEGLRDGQGDGRALIDRLVTFRTKTTDRALRAECDRLIARLGAVCT